MTERTSVFNDFRGRCTVCGAPTNAAGGDYRITTSRNAVDDSYVWRVIDHNTPMHVKLQVLTIHGIAQHDVLTQSNKEFYTHWTPLPRKAT